jgi:hypothetical protein
MPFQESISGKLVDFPEVAKLESEISCGAMENQEYEEKR